MENQDPPRDVDVEDVGRNDEDGGQHVIAAAAAVVDGEVNAIADGIGADAIGRVDNGVGNDADNNYHRQEAGRLNEEDDGGDENGEEIQEENLVEDGEDENPPLPPRMNAISELADVEYEDILDALHDEHIKDQFTISKTSSFMESMIKLRVATPANVVDEFLSVHSTDYQIDYPAILEVVSFYSHHYMFRKLKLSFFVETMKKMMKVGASSKFTVKKDFKVFVGCKEETQKSILDFFDIWLESEEQLTDPLFFRVFDEVRCHLDKWNPFDLFPVMSLLINLVPWDQDDDEYFEEEIACASKKFCDSLRWRNGRLVEIRQTTWLDVDIADDFALACPVGFDRLDALETLSVCCTSLVSLPNLSRLELHRCPIQELNDGIRFPNLKYLTIDHGFDDVNQAIRIATQEVSPVLERLDLSCKGSEDLDIFLTMLKTSDVSKSLKYIDIEARDEDDAPCVKERHLLTLLCEIVPKLNDKCIIVVKTLRHNISFIRLSAELKSKNVSNLKHLYLSSVPKVFIEEERLAVESIAQICDGFFLFGMWEVPYWKFTTTYMHQVYVKMAGNELLKADDSTQFRLDGVPHSLWPRILERADNKCCPKCVEQKLFGTPFQSRCTCSKVHSGLYHLIRHGPALSTRIELSSPKPTPVRMKRDLASYQKRLKQPKLTDWFDNPNKKTRQS